MKAIMYHYVRPFNTDYPNLKNLDFEDFKLQLDYFEQEYGFVSKEDFVQSLKSGTPPKGVVLTFDDGLFCHYDYAFKELKKRGLWGIFYIPTQPYTEGKFIDVHRIHVLLGRNDSKAVYEYLDSLVDQKMLDQDRLQEFEELTYTTQKNDSYTLLVKRMLNYFISYQYREDIVNQLMQRFVPNAKEIFDAFYLNNEQIKEIHDNGMIIGSHTIDHPVMSRLSRDDQERQIKESFAYLEQQVQSFEIKTFCYPYGGFHSFTNETEDLLKESQCLFSFNVEQRDIEENDLLNRPQALPRFDCNQFPHGQVRERNN